jgi:Flp pilus assembly protein TadD
MNNLALVLRSQGKYEEAEQMFRTEEHEKPNNSATELELV